MCRSLVTSSLEKTVCRPMSCSCGDGFPSSKTSWRIAHCSTENGEALLGGAAIRSLDKMENAHTLQLHVRVMCVFVCMCVMCVCNMSMCVMCVYNMSMCVHGDDQYAQE